jgi:CRP-like cAMP-binding protein
MTEHPRGSVLASVGERVCTLRFIVRGSAFVYRDPEHRTLLSRLGVGDCFGVANLFAASPTYPTEIVASTSVTTVEITEAALTALFSQYTTSALNYISFLSERIRFLNRRIADFSCGSAEKKVARLLCLSADGSAPLMLGNLRQTSESMGLGRASLYRVLSDLEERGIIRKDGKEITILKFNDLKGILS